MQCINSIKYVIKVTPVLIYLKLMKKGTLVTRKTLEVAKKCTVKQKVF
jgi:hypothetical protein